MQKPDQKRVRQLLKYHPATGIFTWKVPSNRWGRTPAGAIAGSIRPDGRRAIHIDGTVYLSARIAYLWMVGVWPEKMIDHVDGDKLNDRWKNLRHATRGQNAQNAKKPRHNTSGFKGATPYPYNRKRWIAQLKYKGKHVWLGLHDTAEEAHAAYVEAGKKYFGEFFRAE